MSEPQPAPQSQSPATDWRDRGFLGALFVIIAFLIDPSGDFPLIDDWGYALPIEHFLGTGELRFTGWQSMTLIAQLVWGTLFAAPFGFSFTALRLSTLVAAFFALLAQAALVRALGGNRESERWATLSMLANPVFLLLCFTFMTDVPFLALALASAACLVRALKTDSTRAWVFGMAFAAVGVLLRQMALALPMAFCVAIAVRHGFGRRLFLGAVAPLIGIAVLLFGYEGTIAAAGLESELYPLRSQALGQAIKDLLGLNLGALRLPIDRGFQMLLYTGLFVAPAVFVLAARSVGRTEAPIGRRGLATLLGVSGLATLGLIALDRGLPQMGNILYDLGTGVRTLPGSVQSDGLPDSVWFVVTFLSVLSVALVLLWIARPLIDAWGKSDLRERIAPTVFLVALVIIYFGPLGLAYGPSFERYFLFPAAIAIALASAAVTRATQNAADETPPQPLVRGLRGAAITTLLIWAIVAIGGAHDFMDWNRVRYAMASDLESKGHPSDSIDAGFDYGSWRYTRAALARGEQGGRVDQPDAEIAVGFSAPSEARRLDERELHPWLPGAPTRLYSFERTADAD